LTTEWGALTGLFPCDEVTIAWLEKRIDFVADRGPACVPSDKDGNGTHPRLNQKRILELIDNPLVPSDKDGNGTHPRLNQKRIKELIDNPLRPDNDAEYAAVRGRDNSLSRLGPAACRRTGQS